MRVLKTHPAETDLNLESLSFVTSSADKVREASLVLPFRVNHIELQLREIQSVSLEEVVRHKAEQAWHKVQAPLIVEDTAVRFLAWRHMPGPFIKYFIENLGLLGVVDALSPAKDWRAEAITGVGYADGSTIEYFEGRVMGQIVLPMGKQVFGWDAIFRPNGSGRTYAEMSQEEKVTNSMRTVAMKQLAAYLATRAGTRG